jgi:ATP-dependent helicase/nuclease subunit B
LTQSPEGAPLVLVAPKQATFQLERQLLNGEILGGYTRLQVLSFDRLAEFVCERLNLALPKLLSAEGRLMVLRALLWRHESELTLLRGSARRPGFAQELAGQLTELQQEQFGPARLRTLAAAPALRPELRDKLLDLALLAEKYADWLRQHDLLDASCLLDLAVSRLRAEPNPGHSPCRIQHLWLDGFAEMTPQEHALLTAIIPFCQGATLAFCLETEPTPTDSWLSIWSAIGKTFQRCRAQLTALPGCEVQTEKLPREPGRSRFAEASALGALEGGWALPVVDGMETAPVADSISVVACPHPEAEARCAARELLRFVRQDSRHRFRDCAVLVRNLEPYHRVLAQTFRRYEIPFFLDRRENVTHHPLAELTRNALRMVASDWQSDDWFAALKAGFAPLPETELDRLENAALEFGWRGKRWLEPLPETSLEQLRLRLIPPYANFWTQLQALQLSPTGAQLAAAIRALWAALEVEGVLERWSLPAADTPPGAASQTALHQTVYDQMGSWLDNVAMAFPHEPLSLRDWLPVLDAGLAGLTVGVIPPALDEVLVGAIDRARNPDLKFVLTLGINDTVFPAAPATPAILTQVDREDLDRQNAALGTRITDQISRERYLGYIAFTRASQRLLLTFSRQDAGGRALNPSPFITHLRKRFSQLEIGEFSGVADWRAAEQVGELIGDWARLHHPGASGCEELLATAAVKSLGEKLAWLREPDGQSNLPPALAEKIYGAVLRSSVSRLEEFAQCPFRFFVHSGLRAEERKKFELDARERGSFQHEILKAFHDGLAAKQQRWRDITPAEARARIGQIAAELAPVYHAGLLGEDGQSRFAARALTAALQDFVETLVAWMHSQYDFDPAHAETGFGLDDPGLPPWLIELGGGHALALCGRVDRIDLHPVEDGALAVVMDYKSSPRKLEALLIEHGIQLQLLAYLAAVRRWPADFFGGRRIIPAGVFYVNLRGQFEGGSSRTEVLADPAAARRRAYRHTGRFDASWRQQLDHAQLCDQFNYQLNKDGSVRSNSAEAIASAEFDGLLDLVEAQLKSLGQQIFSGATAVDPYRKGTVTACDYCDYRAVCRIDAWSHQYRELRAADKTLPKARCDETKNS